MANLIPKGKITYDYHAQDLHVMLWLEDTDGTIQDCADVNINITNHLLGLLIPNAAWDLGPTEIGTHWFAERQGIALPAGHPYLAILTFIYSGTPYTRFFGFDIEDTYKDVEGSAGYDLDTDTLQIAVTLKDNGAPANCTACTIRIYDYDGTLKIDNGDWTVGPSETGQYSWYALCLNAGMVKGYAHYALAGFTYLGETVNRLFIFDTFGTTPLLLVDKVWDELRSAHKTQGTFGEISNAIASFTVVPGSDLTHIVTDLAETTDDHFNGQTVKFVIGDLTYQATNITDYDGGTKTLTVDAMTEIPAVGTKGVIV
jgi:hypothetical protein